jgi:hypothetical protein
MSASVKENATPNRAAQTRAKVIFKRKAMTDLSRNGREQTEPKPGRLWLKLG